MKEVNSGGIQPETQQPKRNVIDFETARQKRQAGQKSQIRRSLTPPPTQADRGERDTAKSQKHIKDLNSAHQPADRQAQQQAERTQESDGLVNEMLGGQSEEQIAAHNGQIQARQEKERTEKEKVGQEALKYYERHKARQAAMTPQEREAEKKWREDVRKKFEYSQTPEGRREFAALMVRWMKDLELLPPDLDHLWLNLPSGWAEYTEVPANGANKEPSYTVALDQTPTQEQWDEYYPKLQAKLKAWQVEKAKREHAGDPNYDPMTGDRLLPDEFPLHSEAEYLITGKTRPRRFVPPGSQHLNGYKPLEIHEDDVQPESESNERLVQRLLKAGWTEVAPVGDDWRYFAFCERLRHMSPAEISLEWQTIQREMREGTPRQKEFDPRTDWLALFGQMLRDMMKALIYEDIEEQERKKKQ